MATKKEELSLEDMQRELASVQLETARVTLARAKEENEKYTHTKASRQRSREQAQKVLEGERNMRESMANKCRHRQGGTGLAGMDSGKGDPSVLCATLPLPGHKYYACYRCGVESVTPNPSLKKTNPEQYKREMMEFKKFEELFLESSSTAMGSPVFEFKKDDVPFIPDRV